MAIVKMNGGKIMIDWEKLIKNSDAGRNAEIEAEALIKKAKDGKLLMSPKLNQAISLTAVENLKKG